MNPDPFDPLEKTVHGVLRGQPALQAPSTLERRVREEIARRAARPWWQRSFVEWPAAVRLAFCVLSAAATVVSIAAALAMVNGPGAELAAAFLGKVSTARAVVESGVMAVVKFLGSASSGWFYLAGGVMLAAYAGVFGLGVAAYRLLWRTDEDSEATPHVS